MFVIKSFLFVILAVALSIAQITIDTISTDTITILNEKRASTAKGSTLALIMTAVVPGTGHQLMQRPKSALSFLSADMVGLAGALFFFSWSQKDIVNAKAVAYNHAGVSTTTKNELYWQIIGNVDSYHSFHEGYKNDAREESKRFYQEEYTWDWDDTLYQKRYLDLWKRSKQMGSMSSFFIGAMVLNRIVALVDIRTRTKNQLFTSLSFSPIVNSSTQGIALNTSF